MPDTRISDSAFQIPNSEVEENEILPVIDGELISADSGEIIKTTRRDELTKDAERKIKDENKLQKIYLQYIFLPLIFLTVALFGGLRLDASDSSLIFLRPPLICLIFATILLVLFFRSGLLLLEGWFSENFLMLKNIANGVLLLTLFCASTQIFNSLLPEKGLPFWIFAFCFFWTLWNNLFVEFQGKKLIQSLGSIFALAFVTKYLVLNYMTAPASESWWRGILENPTQEFFTYLFDLPRFAAGTGYIQFFAVVFYMLGLFLLPPVSIKE